MTLEDFGFNTALEKFGDEYMREGFEIGRVIKEHRERYVVLTITGEYEAEITGNMRFTAKNRENFPVVGDWVALLAYDVDFAIIHKVLPRLSTLKRQAVGQPGESQIIATNIDCAFLVQATDRDFNINRLERYLTLCYEAKIKSAIVLTKIDLADEARLSEIEMHLKARIEQIPVFAISNETLHGYDALRDFMEKGKTYCLLGSSGVGKSTLLNNLSGKNLMKTSSISQATRKGRHVTSHRELTILEKGGIIIDNPGMREVGIADTTEGLEITFDAIINLSPYCKFKDCTHTQETGCAVLEAVKNGEINKATYENYLKMEKEKAYYETSGFEKRKKEKRFGKIMKNYKKDRNKY